MAAGSSPHHRPTIREDVIAALRLPAVAPFATPGDAPSWAPGPSRRRLGLLALAGAAAGLLAAVLPPGPAAVAVLALVALAPGALVLAVLPPVPRPVAVVAVPAIGVSLVSLAVSAQLAAASLAPTATHWTLTILGAVGGAVLTLRGGNAPRVRRTADGDSERDSERDSDPYPAPESEAPDERRGGPVSGIVLPLVLAAAATAAWIAALPSARAAAYSTFGLAPQAPLLVVAVVLALLGVLAAVRAGGGAGEGAGGGLVGWVALVALVLARRGYTLGATDAPLYQWTYRHLGVMDWFTHSGTLARDVDVYSNWPGSLAFAAWVTQVSGLSRFDLASAYIIGHHLVLVVVVYALARAAGSGRRTALLAAALVEVTDWVGQDYLAPQSFGFLLGAVVIACWLASRDDRYRVGSLWVAGIVFTGITWAHQLTPVWLLAVLVALIALRVVRPAWVLLPFLAIWGVMVAVNLSALLAHSTGISLNLLSNTAGNITSPVSAGQALTSRTVTVLAIVLWLATALVAGAQLRRDRAGLVAPIIAFSPMLLLLTGYGGEAVYRVYLYSLLGCALVLAGPLTGLLRAGIARASLAALAVGALTLASLQGSLGGWFAGLFPRADVDLAVRLERAAGENGLIATPTVGFPRQVTWYYVPQARRDALGLAVWSLQNELVTPDGISATPVDRLTRGAWQQMAQEPVYVVIAGPMHVYAEQYGALPPGGLDELAALLRARGWAPAATAADGTVVYANPAGQGAWQRAADLPLETE